MMAGLRNIPAGRHVLIAGPTASGKTALALELAARDGGTIVNADASQVYDCWRILTARPSLEEEAQAPHALFGHVAATDPYSTGHWLRDVARLLNTGTRLIITGGTGLYFQALTHGLADIPATPTALRQQADAMTLAALTAQIDADTLSRIDPSNRARVQRAWEVQQATGTGLAAWQDRTASPLLPLESCHAVALDVDRDWLNARIETRFDAMLQDGALDEAAAQRAVYDPSLPAHRAIGVPELMAHLEGALSLKEARARIVIATRRFAKRQRTWQRSKMADWHPIPRP